MGWLMLELRLNFLLSHHMSVNKICALYERCTALEHVFREFDIY